LSHLYKTTDIVTVLSPGDKAAGAWSWPPTFI